MWSPPPYGGGQNVERFIAAHSAGNFASVSIFVMIRSLLPIALLALAGCAALPAVSSINSIANGLARPGDSVVVPDSDLRSLQLLRFRVNKDVAFAAAMTALMDAGYRTQSADIGTGLIVAGAPSADKVQLDLRGVVISREAPIASVYVEQLPEGSSVRTSFAIEQATRGFAGNGERALQDPALYATFFARLETEIANRSALPKPAVTEADDTDIAADLVGHSLRGRSGEF